MTEFAHPKTVGVFHDREQAARAVEGLKLAGFADYEIGLVVPHDGFTPEPGTQMEEWTVLGVLAGAGLLGLGVVAGLIPSVGPVIAGGTLAAVLANAAGGAAVAGLAGALIGHGIPEGLARYCEEQVREGRAVVTVDAGSRGGEATDILRRCGTFDLHAGGVAVSEGSAVAHAAVADSPQTAGELTRGRSDKELEAAVRRIADYPGSPGKRDAIAECLEDIERSFGVGTLTGRQRGRLIAILLRDEGWEWREEEAGEGA
jgi:hypothetical protein